MRLHLNLIFIVLLFRMLMTSIKRWGKCKSDIRLLSVILILIWKFYSCGHEIVQTEPVKVRGIQSGEEDRGRGIPHQPPGDRCRHQSHIQGEKILRSQMPCSLVLIHHISLYLQSLLQEQPNEAIDQVINVVLDKQFEANVMKEKTKMSRR